jgi:Xaa-Pro aminopeptidase
MITQREYKARRQTLMSNMDKDSIAIISTSPEYPKTQDIPHRFRPNGNFYHLTGFDEPEAIAVLIPNRKEGEFVLFNRPRDPAKEIWDGFRQGQEGAIKSLGADQSYSIKDFDTEILKLIHGKKHIYYQIGFEVSLENKIVGWITDLRQQSRSGTVVPTSLNDVTAMINEMRLIKSDAEIAVMRKAGEINREAHERAMKNCKVGMTESQLAAEYNYIYNRHGCWSMAYEPIVAGGENACILHYRAGLRVLNDGELVLADVGQEYEWYASDVTRTFPVNGKFSPEQKAVYELVLSIQEAILAMIKPGLSYDKMQETAIKLTTQGLIDLGILKGNVAELIEKKAYIDFYMHRSGHWIGSDVHDVSAYKIDGQWVTLKPGMALTVEPGIYIAANNQNVDAKWRGIGVRIEDDIVVTENGHENLTGSIPKTVKDIEAFMAK